MDQRTKEQVNLLSREVLNAAFSVHQELGPGLLEAVYHHCMINELQLRQISYNSSIPVPIVYKGREINKHYELDLLVGNEIIVELKSVDALHPVHEAQLLTYLKITGKRLGLLINFNVPLLKNGIRRLVYKF
jgi:GxxExxY protein